MNLKNTNSLTLRITLLFSIASIVVLLALGFMIKKSVGKHFEELDANLLSANVHGVKQVLSEVSPNFNLRDLAKRIERVSTSDNRLAVILYDAQGQRQVVGSLSGLSPDLFLKFGDTANKTIIWHDGEVTYRGFAEPISSGISVFPVGVVVTAIDISHHEHFMMTFQVSLWSFVGIAALLMGFLGWAAATRGLQPLKSIQRDASDISANRLDKRLSVDELPSELAELGHALNDMLSRLQESFKRLSDFSADIAHELRTPVSNLMTQTQVALSKSRTADEYRDILASNAEELERMARMISDMLFLAKADNGLMPLQVQQISMAHEFNGLREFYDALLDEKSIKLIIEGDAEIQGDNPMLLRAFSNLLSNAIRHTQPGEAVSVQITHPNKSSVLVEVRNPGDISQQHLPHLFERFYRADPSRHRDGDNSGLGLPITKSIIEAHGGSICVKSENGIVRFAVTLPKIDAQQFD